MGACGATATVDPGHSVAMMDAIPLAADRSVVTTWRSPNSGGTLVADTPWSLADDSGERWPVVDGIPYLRIGRDGLVADTLSHLDAGDTAGATALLLADREDGWDGPVPDPADLARLVRAQNDLSLHEAMALLRFGAMADYCAHRWTDPAFLAGLALLEEHWHAPARAFELACGIGPCLRELSRRGVACLGGDVVFACCWLARHWVAPDAQYVVFDAGGRWPLTDDRFDLAMCHDAFHLLPDQAHVAACLRVSVAEGGVLAIGHLPHAAPGVPPGPARSATAWRGLFPDAVVYDERALLAALFEPRVPVAAGWRDDPRIAAWSLVEGSSTAGMVEGWRAMPPAGAGLRPDPLLSSAGPACRPSDAWRDARVGSCRWTEPAEGIDPVRLRRKVDPPGRR